MISHWTDYGLGRYRRVEDKMEEYVQKNILVNKFEINPLMNYLQTNYGLASAGVFDLKEKGKIKIQSFGDKVEVMCMCDKNSLAKLLEVIEQNE